MTIEFDRRKKKYWANGQAQRLGEPRVGPPFMPK